MHHYSVYYDLARATEHIAKEGPFPEEVFALLDTCGDNVRDFFKSIKQIVGDFGRRSSNYRLIRKDSVTTELYRNLMSSGADLSSAKIS